MNKMKRLIAIFCCVTIICACTQARKKDTQAREKVKPELFRETEHEGVRATVDDGNVMLRFDREQISSYVSSDRTDYRLEDRSYAVEGLSGNCKGVFISDIGQDINPILCMLMEDGGVEILDLFHAARCADFRSSGRMNGYDRITGFVAGSVVDDVNGNSYCLPFDDEPKEWAGGYASIFAMDKSGKYKEIELLVYLQNEWYHFRKGNDGTVPMFVLDFSSDWKISYAFGWYLSEWAGSYTGRFRQIDGDYKQGTFEFEMLDYTSFDYENTTMEKVSLKGRFSMRSVDDNSAIEVISLEGLPFGANETEKKVRFTFKDTPEWE